MEGPFSAQGGRGGAVASSRHQAPTLGAAEHGPAKSTGGQPGRRGRVRRQRPGRVACSGRWLTVYDPAGNSEAHLYPPPAARRQTYTSPGGGHWLVSAAAGASPGTGTRSISPHAACLASARIVSISQRAVDGSPVIPVATIGSVLSSGNTAHCTAMLNFVIPPPRPAGSGRPCPASGRDRNARLSLSAEERLRSARKPNPAARAWPAFLRHMCP